MSASSIQHPLLPFTLMILLILSGCAVSPREPCIKNGHPYGIPDDPVTSYEWDSCYQSGLSYSEGGCWKKAIEQFSIAIKQKPKDRWMARSYGMHFLDYFPHREQGIVFYHQGNFQDAIKELSLSLTMAESGKTKYFLNQARKQWLEEIGGDSTPPQLFFDHNIPAQETLFTNRTTYLLSGTAVDDFFVGDITIDDQPLFIDLARSQIPFKQQVHLSPGENLIHCTVADLAGNATSQATRIHLDQECPILVFAPVSSDSLEGIAFDTGGLSSLTIDGTILSLAHGETLKRFRITLPPLPHLTFKATDRAGNVTEGKFSPLPEHAVNLARTRVCTNGHLKGLLASADKSALHIEIDDLPPVVFENSVVISGWIESNSVISNVWINGISILPPDETEGLIPYLRELLYGGRIRFFFTHRIASLKEGENVLTLCAEDKKGLSPTKTITVNYHLHEAKKIGSRWQLAVFRFKEHRLKRSMIDRFSSRPMDLYTDMIESFKKTGRFKLLEREQMTTILDQHVLQSIGMIDITTGIHLGKMLNAEVILIGDMKEVWDGKDYCLEISSRLIDVETTEILETNSVCQRWKTKLDETSLLKWLAQMYVEDFPLLKGEIVGKHTPLFTEPTFQMDLGSEDLLKRGMKVLVYPPLKGGKKVEESTMSLLNLNKKGEGRVTEVAQGYSLASPMPKQSFDSITKGDWVITK